MSRLGCLLLIWAICEGVFAKEEKQNGFVQPLDFSPIFDYGNTGVSLASGPISAALIKADKSQYPHLFDTVVSSSIDSLQRSIAPKENIFSSEHFGFNPIPSQGYHGPAQAARLVQAPRHPHPPPPQPQQRPYAPVPIQHQQITSPLLYDIRQIHDADYKVYKPEDENQNQQGGDILSALKKNPSVASYFKPAKTNLEVAHPLKYRTEDSIENPDDDQQNYKPNAYVAGPSRIRRYASGRRSERLRKASDEDEDPYEYKGYQSKPKEFDSDPYSSPYKEEKDPNKEYEYPYGGYNSEYDHKEYERIKELSEKQAAEIRQNPGNCKEVQRDGMTCMTCKDPKTGGNYESCSYAAEPKNNKYAYSKEKKFDSNDEPDEPEGESKSEPKKSEHYEKAKEESGEYSAPESDKPQSAYTKKDDDSGEKYKSYYKPPAPSEALRSESSESDSSEEKADPLVKPYNYKQALPGFYTDTEPKKDVEHVLEEFRKKDRSACKKVHKNGMTCFQCIDKNGLKNEECMFVSESAPKRSHLAYQEVKEFTSKPPTLEGVAEGAESKTITSPPLAKSAALVVSNNGYGKKLKRKKARQPNLTPAIINPVSLGSTPTTQLPYFRRIAKRSVDSEAELKEIRIVDETNVAPPEEFAGDNSKGAFWAETMPRYSAALGVTLPEYMLARSEHEASFDETVAGA